MNTNMTIFCEIQFDLRIIGTFSFSTNWKNKPFITRIYVLTLAFLVYNNTKTNCIECLLELFIHHDETYFLAS